MKHYHPRKDDHDQLVELLAPNEASALSSWADPRLIATITPAGPSPASLAGICFADWVDAPITSAGWEKQAALTTHAWDEPPMASSPGKSAASGVVIREGDGRVWVVSPSNAFGGYVNTFPKGRLDAGLSLRANALKEAYEETGLHVALTGFLCDSKRSTSVTRYYTAKRMGGQPAKMGWETQAVHLVPKGQLAALVSHHNDKVILQALQALR